MLAELNKHLLIVVGCRQAIVLTPPGGRDTERAHRQSRVQLLLPVAKPPATAQTPAIKSAHVGPSIFERHAAVLKRKNSLFGLWALCTWLH